MTKKEWLQKAQDNKDILLQFIEAWHPGSDGMTFSIDEFPITAPNAEAACNEIRKEIAKEWDKDQLISPMATFYVALVNKDIGTMLVLLNQAWFGVPESTSCWNIPGFKEAVELLEEPPDQE